MGLALTDPSYLGGSTRDALNCFQYHGSPLHCHHSGIVLMACSANPHQKGPLSKHLYRMRCTSVLTGNSWASRLVASPSSLGCLGFRGKSSPNGETAVAAVGRNGAESGRSSAAICCPIIGEVEIAMHRLLVYLLHFGWKMLKL